MTVPSKPKPFDRRAFVALTAALCGLGLPLTGYMNHVHQIEPLTRARHAWMAAHNSLGITFAIFTLWHILLNRKAFMKHLRGALTFQRLIRPEMLYATGLVAILLLFFVGHAFHVQ
jgi:hypothetical protein